MPNKNVLNIDIVVKYKYDTNIHNDVLPVFNGEFGGYFWVDEVEDLSNPNILTRTIKTIDGTLPTKINFGRYFSENEKGHDVRAIYSVDYVNTSNINNMNIIYKI